MTIEKSPTPLANHKPAASAGSHGARAKAAAGDAAAEGAGTGAGFMAILDSLEVAPVDSQVPDAGNADALASDVASAAATDARVPPPFDASVLLQQNPQIAAAQVAQVAAMAVPAPDPAAMAQALAGAGLLQPTPTAASTAVPLTQTLSTGVAPPAPAGPSTASRFGAAAGQPSAAQAATANALAGPATDAVDPAEPATQGLQHAFTRAKAGQDAVQSLADAGTAARGGAAVADERAESNKFLTAMEQARAATTPRALETVLAPLVSLQDKQEKAQSERRSGSLKAAEPTYSGTTVGTSATDTSLSGATATAMAPDMQVAEQVSYWVSHNVQNAELSLDGLGQSPVQVSISLQGNEAQISFRTDEAAAREVLQNAAAHLTDMLRREGLVLTGVSVGHSGSGNADGSERRARPNVRQTQIAPLQAASLDSGPRLRTATTGATGRSVDLFV